MRNDAFRNAQSKILAACLIAASTLLLSSCGGGGAAGDPTVGSAVRIIPNVGTAYAGIPYNVLVTGGRAPYVVGSSEPTIFPVPAISDGSFVVLPQNPSVVDTGLTAGEVPRRAVVVQARDVNGVLAVANVSVLQNFLVGYGVSYTNTCPAPAAAAGSTAVSPQACPGRESLLVVSPTFNGQLRGNALLRFERIRGDFGFTQCGSPPPANAALVNAITQNTDTRGIANVCIFVPTSAGTQIASYRIIDVATGVYADQIFIIDGSATPGPLTPIPNAITFTGVNGRCGVGSADFLVFGGTPPYSATSTNGSVAVAPSTSSSQPGRFTATVSNTQVPCPTGVQIVITDSLGARGTVAVSSVAGAAAPALTVAPQAFTLNCGQSGTAVVVGGNGPYSVFSSGGGVVATVSGNQVVITRTGGPVAVPPQQQTTVNITDGASIATITVDSPSGCT